MECAYGDHLRNLALVWISRELRARSKRRSPALLVGEQGARKTHPLVILRKKTDEARKALRDHITDCQRCQNANQEGTSRSTSEEPALVG